MTAKTTLVAGLCLAAGLVPQAAVAEAGAYPGRPVELIIPYPPGGSDTLGRLIANSMSEMTGEDIVVVNVPGASTQIASRRVAGAKPDGYTIYIATPSEFLSGMVFQDNLPFDPMKDFTFISHTAEAPYMLMVNPELPVTNYEEFAAYLSEHPQDILFGSYGPLSQSDLIARRFRAETGIDFDIIPYSGGTPSFNALLSGEIQALFATSIPTRDFIRNGQMRPLAVTTGERVALFPDLPTLREAGVDVVDSLSFALVGPAGLPDEVVDYWNKNWTAAMNDPETHARIEEMSVTVIESSPQELRSWFDENLALWQSFPETLDLDAAD